VNRNRVRPTSDRAATLGVGQRGSVGVLVLVLVLALAVAVAIPPAAGASTATVHRPAHLYDDAAVARATAQEDVEAAGILADRRVDSAKSSERSVLLVSKPHPSFCAFFATNSADDLLAQARADRDDLAQQVESSKATVTGGYDPKTGRVVAGCNSNPIGCAEHDVGRQLDIPDGEIKFTEAIRPRTGEQVPICEVCQGRYDPSQFPPGTKPAPGGPGDR